MDKTHVAPPHEVPFEVIEEKLMKAGITKFFCSGPIDEQHIKRVLEKFDLRPHVFYLASFDGKGTRHVLIDRLPRVRPPLARLTKLTDWVPSSAVRKRQLKLIADDSAEIAQFRVQGRKWLARWRLAWTWIYWFLYFVSGPISAALRAILVKLA